MASPAAAESRRDPVGEDDEAADDEEPLSEGEATGEADGQAPSTPPAHVSAEETVTPSTPGSASSLSNTDDMFVALKNTVNRMTGTTVSSRQQEIGKLKKMRADAVAARKRAQRLIRDEDREKRRIYEKAKTLSTNDMFELIAHRAEVATRRLASSASSAAESTAASSGPSTS